MMRDRRVGSTRTVPGITGASHCDTVSAAIGWPGVTYDMGAAQGSYGTRTRRHRRGVDSTDAECNLMYLLFILASVPCFDFRNEHRGTQPLARTFLPLRRERCRTPAPRTSAWVWHEPRRALVVERCSSASDPADACPRMRTRLFRDARDATQIGTPRFVNASTMRARTPRPRRFYRQPRGDVPRRQSRPPRGAARAVQLPRRTPAPKRRYRR